MSTEFQETLSWLYAREARLGMNFRLDRLQPALDALGRPETDMPVVHIAGTNGKGSTAAMIHSVYTAAGYRCGLYTSPHLLSFCERIRVGENSISEDEVVAFTGEIRDAMRKADQELTFFEIATLMGLLAFRAHNVDMAVVEVGMGGRLDATNVVSPVLSIITSVAVDHAAYLGDSIEEIAWEKAGIVRDGVPLVTGPLEPAAEHMVDAIAEESRAPRLRYGRDFGPAEPGAASGGIGLVGGHQRVNAAVALASLRALAERFPVSDEAIARGMASVRWPARFERVASAPAVIIDAAHNPDAVRVLAGSLCEAGLGRPRVLVFGVMADKDWPEMLAVLLPLFDRAIFVPVSSPRGLDPQEALAIADGIVPACAATSARGGLHLAREAAGAEGSVVIAGSIFLAGDLYVEAGGDPNPFRGAGNRE